MAIVDNLFIKLGYEYDEAKMEKFNELATGTGKILKTGSLAVLGLATSFSFLFAKLSANALAQKRFGQAMGVSRASVAAFDRTSEELTGDSGTAAGFIEKFNGIQNAVKAGVAPSEEFLRSISMMGISLEEFQSLRPDQALLRLSEGFQGLGEDSQDAVSHLMSLDSAGRNLFTGLTADRLRANVPAPADLASIEKFDGLMKDLKQTFNDAIVTFGTPLFEKLIPAIKTLNSNMPQIIGFARDATKMFNDLGVAIGSSIGWAVVQTNKLIENFDRLVRPITKSGYQSPENTYSGLTGLIEGFAKQELGLFGGDNRSSSTSIKQTFNIKVTSDNPEVVAETIQRVGKEQMSQANKNLTGSVAN